MTEEQNKAKKELKYVFGMLLFISGCIIISAILL